MKRLSRLIGCVAIVLALAAFGAENSRPLIRAHAHNDYMHERPLLDALDHGFCSVEADIHLVNGQLLVAHDLDKTTPERTLQALYLDPLRARIKANGGHVYPDGPPCWLLIDIKTDPQTTYPALHTVLEQYADILSVFRDGKQTQGAITVVVDGGRGLIAAQPVRYASVDGGLKDLDSDASPDLIPWISSSWRDAFAWKGIGTMPEAERAKLRECVQRAHAKGRLIRFWGLPFNTKGLWPELYDAGVDLLNADDLAGLQQFLMDREKK